MAALPRVLIIAGSDSGGGAGIQADLKTMSALGAFGMTAITALTAQNTTGVYGVVEMPPEFVAHQIEVCVSDIGCDAAKTGMLSSAALIGVVATKIREYRLDTLVVDPVMIAKSGAPLLKPDAIDALKTQLLPLAKIITPNLYEAGALTGREIQTLVQMKEAARVIHGMGPRNVVVKGGHLARMASDVLFDGSEATACKHSLHSIAWTSRLLIERSAEGTTAFPRAWDRRPRSDRKPVDSRIADITTSRHAHGMGPPMSASLASASCPRAWAHMRCPTASSSR